MIQATGQKFKLQNCPLDGINIIEASAGTGKTYTIQNLYAKLILLKGYKVDSILVVTFTDAATKELKIRIRHILTELDLYFKGKAVSDNIKELVETTYYWDCNDKKVTVSQELKRKRIYNAINNFDDASIFTIHGFCNKVLNDHSFETGILFNVQLEKNIEPIVRDITEDFWRLETYSASSFDIAALNYNSINIETLSSYVKNFTSKGDIYVYPEKVSENRKFNILKNIFYDMKSNWNIEEIKTILERPEISKAKFRESSVNKHIQNIELFFNYAFNKEIIETISKLTIEYVSAAVKKTDKQKFQPNHPFFNNCSEFINDIDSLKDFGIYTRSKFRSFFHKEYEKRKNELNVQSFNDLLSKVDEYTEGSKSRLLQKLRSKYNAAFIDEFQDTDSVQYSIFKKIFIDSSKTIFMVGDPKQAIYGFRGGDIFTYRKAKEQISETGRLYTLPKNWRSSPNMVEAVNNLFTKGKPGNKPFVTDSINYIEVESDEKNDNFGTASDSKNKPLKFIFINEPQSSENLSNQCTEQTAAQIHNILSDDNNNITESNGIKRRIKPSDIAMLVTKHSQAKLLQPKLAEYKIPAVLQATGSVFDTTEAENFVHLLNAVAEPSNTQILKGALLTNILSYSIDDLVILSEEAEDDIILQFEEIYSKFKKCHDIWLNNTFIEMFNCLCFEFNIKERILQQNSGERTLTNVLHIAEILQTQETELKLGINGLIHWLSKQMSPDSREDKDEYEIRLETDENAVKIMTVFKSKGLEFPIVFCPFLWDKNAISVKQQRISKYHLTPDIIGKTSFKDELLYKPILDITGKEDAENYSNDENLEELMRFMYVALTRSKYQCYVIWGNTDKNSKKNTSALDYMFYSDCSVLEAEKGNIAKALSYSVKSVKNANTSPALTVEQKRNIQLDIYDTNQKFDIKEYKPIYLNKAIKLKARIISSGNQNKSWKISSFSSLTPHSSEASRSVSQKDYDETDISNSTDHEQNTILNTKLDIFNFPAGAKTGTCWHEIFEEIDFASSDEEIRSLVKEKLLKYRLNEKESGKANEESIICVQEMVKNVLNKTLNRYSNLSLKNITAENKLPEMEFLFSLKQGIDMDKLYTFLSSYAKENDFTLNSCSEKLLNNKLIHGYMTGFIDLIFRDKNKYYIIDWKSNKLNGIPEDFTIKGLKQEISKHYYFLQYLIYTVAVDKYLQTHIKNYDYDTHFGGVYYIFLRGVDSFESSNKGVFFDKPDKKYIKELAGILA